MATASLAGGSAQQMIRTGAGITCAPYVQAAGSIYPPQAPTLCKMHMREEINMQYVAGTPFAVGVNAQWQASRDIDVTPYVLLRFQSNPVPAASWQGGATFARYVDNLGLSAWEKCTVQSGPIIMQQIYPEEIMCYILKWLDINARQNALRAIGAGTPAERDTVSLRTKEYNVPIFTCMGFRMHGDPSQGLYIRGLNDVLKWTFIMRAANLIIETDGTMPTTPAATGFLSEGNMVQVGQHIQEDERQMLLSFYQENAFSIHFDDQQYASEIIFPFNQPIPSTVTTQLLNITQPVTAMFFIFRFRNDVERVAGDANGTRGRDWWNWGGVYNAGGGVQDSIIDTIRISSGNNDIEKTIPVDRLKGFQHYTDFQGPANTPLAGISWSHDASQPNAVLGFISFEQIERPLVSVSFKVPQTGTAFATVGAAATADIGSGASSASDLKLQVLAFTKNEIAVAKYLLSRAFN